MIENYSFREKVTKIQKPLNITKKKHLRFYHFGARPVPEVEWFIFLPDF